jgi:diaminohydroxyphosphoribosylaminopyrimidine deaminase/5-amino-6-(5-phosphoribosylamino)uracil reductase
VTTDDARGDWSGLDVARVTRGEGGVDLDAALRELGRRGLCHVLVEAGPTLAGSLAAAGLVDRFVLYVAPKIIGGDAPGAFASGVKTITEAWRLEIDHVARVGDDIRIDARPR